MTGRSARACICVYVLAEKNPDAGGGGRQHGIGQVCTYTYLTYLTISPTCKTSIDLDAACRSSTGVWVRVWVVLVLVWVWWPKPNPQPAIHTLPRAPHHPCRTSVCRQRRKGVLLPPVRGWACRLPKSAGWMLVPSSLTCEKAREHPDAMESLRERQREREGERGREGRVGLVFHWTSVAICGLGRQPPVILDTFSTSSPPPLPHLTPRLAVPNMLSAGLLGLESRPAAPGVYVCVCVCEGARERERESVCVCSRAAVGWWCLFLLARAGRPSCWEAPTGQDPASVVLPSGKKGSRTWAPLRARGHEATPPTLLLFCWRSPQGQPTTPFPLRIESKGAAGNFVAFPLSLPLCSSSSGGEPATTDEALISWIDPGMPCRRRSARQPRSHGWQASCSSSSSSSTLSVYRQPSLGRTAEASVRLLTHTQTQTQTHMYAHMQYPLFSHAWRTKNGRGGGGEHASRVSTSAPSLTAAA